MPELGWMPWLQSPQPASSPRTAALRILTARPGRRAAPERAAPLHMRARGFAFPGGARVEVDEGSL